GHIVQLAAGTTNMFIMDALIETQLKSNKGLDIVIMTTSLPIIAKGREAKERHVEQLQGMQLILTGGALHGPTDSLIGSYAVEGVSSPMLRPTVVFCGAAG